MSADTAASPDVKIAASPINWHNDDFPILGQFTSVDEMLAVKVGEAAAAEVEPQEDIHASAAYRRALTGTLTERALKAAAAR